MTNKFGDISSNLDILNGQVLRSKLDGSGFESYDIATDLDNKIEASDIVNFETTTQLNTRDIANRNRANHTGSQAISTITNLQTSLDSKANTSHTHTSSSITDLTSTIDNNTNVLANTSARHTHSNKALLDTYTQTEVNIADAVTKKHTHSNKTILDQIANNPVETIVAGTNVTLTRTGNSVTINSTGGGGGSGDVLGPVSATNNGVALFDGTTGKLIKDSAKTIVTTLGSDDTTIPTSKAVADAIGTAGGGDMLKSVYDTNNDGIVNQADVITNQGDLATLDTVNTDQIDNSAVTNGKLAHMNSNTVKGRLSGDGVPQDVPMADLPISTATQSALDGKQPLSTVLTNTTASYTTAIDTRLANTSGTNTGDQDLSGLVSKTGNETIAGVKTFSSNPVVSTGIEIGHASDTTLTRVGAGRLAVEGIELVRNGDNPTLTTINISNADTTISRVSAGKIAVEGVNVVTTSSTDTLTNKTMTGTTNTITASVLKSATTEINVSSATAPTTGQVLTATSGTAATWQTPTGGGVSIKNLQYPHSTTGFTTFAKTIGGAGAVTYTPTSGKVGYITKAIVGGLGSEVFQINSIAIGEFSYINSSGLGVIFNPLILDDGDNLGINTTAYSGYIMGFEAPADANITPITVSGAYTVPAGKIYIVTNLYSSSATTITNAFTIGGTTINWYGGINNIETDMDTDMGFPAILKAGDSINTTFNHNGYLVPDTYTF